jgi:hypothetical protein
MFTWTELSDYSTDDYVLTRDHYLRSELVYVGYSKRSPEYRRALISGDEDGGVGQNSHSATWNTLLISGISRSSR